MNEEEQINAVFDLEIDFENYNVPEQRAAAIREQLVAIKAKSWLASLADWIHAQGQDYFPFGEQTELGETPQKRIAFEQGHKLEALELIFDGVETEIRLGGKKFLALQKLPKGDEILLSHYTPDLLSQFNELETELHEQLKVYLKAKAEKTKAFQDRFKKVSAEP